MQILDRSTAVVVTTRPAGQGVKLCRRLRRRGIRALNLPAVRLAPMADRQAAATALVQARRVADVLIFTSPAAVRFAHELLPDSGQSCRLAVGSATARALQHVGWGPAVVPETADSEGLLALPDLQDIAGQRVAIIGAEGGRKLLGQTLAQRGAVVIRAHVYQRLPARLDARHWRQLQYPARPFVMVMSSSQSIGMLAERVDPRLWCRLRSGVAVVSSSRMVQMAIDLGFCHRVRAASATDRDLADAILRLF